MVKLTTGIPGYSKTTTGDHSSFKKESIVSRTQMESFFYLLEGISDMQDPNWFIITVFSTFEI